MENVAVEGGEQPGPGAGLEKAPGGAPGPARVSFIWGWGQTPVSWTLKLCGLFYL